METLHPLKVKSIEQGFAFLVWLGEDETHVLTIDLHDNTLNDLWMPWYRDLDAIEAALQNLDLASLKVGDVISLQIPDPPPVKKIPDWMYW